MKISKIYLRICSLLFACFLVCGSILRPVVTYASPYDLMIGSSSNALMTLELDDSDYLMMSPRSSVGTVSNTINEVWVQIYVSNGTYTNNMQIYPRLVNGRWQFSWSMPDYYSGYYVQDVHFFLYGYGTEGLPSPSGTYNFSMDFSSDFSATGFRATPDLFSVKEFENASLMTGSIDLDYFFQSGDFYIPVIPLDIRSGYDNVRVRLNYYPSDNLQNYGGSFAVNFTKTSDNGQSLIGGSDSGTAYESDVSSSLSDLSSSVDTMTEDLSSAAENLEYISTSQNLIIQGIDNVVMHISDQLFAFWNQLFNLIHVPTMAKMDDIIDVIRNMDLEIEVNLDGLKQSIQQASQNEIANDNKVSADQIANNEANTEEVKDAVKEHGNFIIDGLKGLFIPSDEFFKAYFDDLYAYFSDRFGFLSFPIDLVIRIADLFLTSEKVDAVLTLPSFEISGYKVWEDYSFNFTEFLETSFPFLISAIQTVTSIGLIMAFVNLCQDKWNEVMRS